jgi:hypothetical protein
LALLALHPEQFAVIWRARTRSWLPIPERVAAMVAGLPEAAGHEVLDFARFLRARQQRVPVKSQTGPAAVGQRIPVS